MVIDKPTDGGFGFWTEEPLELREACSVAALVLGCTDGHDQDERVSGNRRKEAMH